MPKYLADGFNTGDDDIASPLEPIRQFQLGVLNKTLMNTPITYGHNDHCTYVTRLPCSSIIPSCSTHGVKPVTEFKWVPAHAWGEVSYLTPFPR